MIGLLRAWRKEERLSPLDPLSTLRTLGLGLLVVLPLLALQVLHRTQLSLQQEQASRSDTVAIMEAGLVVSERAARDWGHWDDAHRFALGVNPGFEKESLATAALFDGGGVMLILDRQGEPLLIHTSPRFRLPSYEALIRCTRDNLKRLPDLRSTVRLACPIPSGVLYVGSAATVTDNAISVSTGASLAMFEPLVRNDYSPQIRQRLQALRHQLVFQPLAVRQPADTQLIQPPIHSRNNTVLAVRRPSLSRVLGQVLLEDLPLLGAIPLLVLALRGAQLLRQRRRRILQRQADRQANRRIRQAGHALEALLGGTLPSGLLLQPPGRVPAPDLPAPTPASRPQPLLERITHRFQTFVHSASTLALLDTLTQLPNRRYFLARVEEVAHRHREERRQFAVLFVDIDKFKVINDSFGHTIGDAVLVTVCQRLEGLLGPEDFLARYGGDELAVILDLSEVEDPTPDGYNAATQERARRMVAAMADPLTIGDLTIVVSLSIGITLVDPQEHEVGRMIQRADLAMYQAKRSRYTRIVGPADLAQLPQLSSYQLFSDLIQAIGERQLQVFFQPIGDAEGHWQGVEALARWLHPQRGWIEPQLFLDLAEQHRQMQVLGRELIRLSLDGFQALHASRPGLPLYLNLAPSQLLDPGLADTLLEQLQQRGLQPGQLVLELTEHSILEPNPAVQQNLERLRQAGMGLALDDFGTGYSSLVLLRTLKPDVVKIDKSFTRDVAEDGDAVHIIRLIAALAPRLKLKLIAEGIEDQATLERLSALGIGLFQGYVLAGPAPVSAWLGHRDPDQTASNRSIV